MSVDELTELELVAQVDDEKFKSINVQFSFPSDENPLLKITAARLDSSAIATAMIEARAEAEKIAKAEYLSATIISI